MCHSPHVAMNVYTLQFCTLTHTYVWMAYKINWWLGKWCHKSSQCSSNKILGIGKSYTNSLWSTQNGWKLQQTTELQKLLYITTNTHQYSFTVSWYSIHSFTRLNWCNTPEYWQPNWDSMLTFTFQCTLSQSPHSWCHAPNPIVDLPHPCQNI